MSTPTDMFTCGACSRQFRWKPELAGKRVKCKCGNRIGVPLNASTLRASSPPAPKSRASLGSQAKRSDQRGTFNGLKLKDDGLFDLGLPTEKPVVDDAVVRFQPTPKERGGVGQAFLGVPPIIGFWLAAIGISFVLGGIVVILSPPILDAVNLLPSDNEIVARRYGRTVVLLMMIGPYLCLLAPTDWKARTANLIVAGMITYMWAGFSLDRMMRDTFGTVAGVFLLSTPFVFFIFLSQFGRSFGAQSLSNAARIMCCCLYAVLGLGYWSSTIHWTPSDRWLAYLLGYSMIGLLGVLVLFAVKAIFIIIAGAMSARTKSVG